MARGSVKKITSKLTGTVTYQVRVEFPPAADGTRVQRSKTFRTRELAEKQRTAWLIEIDKGTSVPPSKLTVAWILEEWLDKVATHNVRPTSMQGYRFTIDTYLKPRLGGMRAQQLAPIHLQTMTSDLKKEGKGDRTIQLCHLRLSQALDWAMRMGFVNRNICQLVDRPSPGKRKPTVWTPAQAERFLSASENWRPLFELILTTGIRREEAIGLMWDDVDLERRTLEINRTVVQLTGKGLSFQAPKTDNSHRRIRLDEQTARMLRQHKKNQNAHRLRLGPAWEDNDLIFPNDFGGLLFPDNVQRAFQRILKVSGVPRIRIHDLRHSHATWLLLEREPIQVVSERLGHSKPSITMDLYAHTLADSQDSAADRMDQILPRKRASGDGA